MPLIIVIIAGIAGVIMTEVTGSFTSGVAGGTGVGIILLIVYFLLDNDGGGDD